ncbi:MAG: DUF1990 domain-containing protein [Phaeodactylibacter sp.]|nr:DUF1990 domain-containing protein [Phaeodactylibacter sp.]
MPRFFFNDPQETTKDAFLLRQEGSTFSYPELAATKAELPSGYNHDHNSVCLGQGRAIFERSCTALKQWKQFPDWVQIHPNVAPLEKGMVVGLFFRVFGLYWTSACRIVYTFAEQDRFGFAYGTLPAHMERGEECFWIEFREDGSVWYHIRAFSRPAFWLVRLVKPIARRFQARFVRDSQQAMLKWARDLKVQHENT